MIDILLTILISLAILLWSVSIMFLNLYCKDEIWEEIYERMGLLDEGSIK